MAKMTPRAVIFYDHEWSYVLELMEYALGEREGDLPNNLLPRILRLYTHMREQLCYPSTTTPNEGHRVFRDVPKP